MQRSPGTETGCSPSRSHERGQTHWNVSQMRKLDTQLWSVVLARKLDRAQKEHRNSLLVTVI